MSDAPEPDPYFRAIEEEFLRRRGAPLLLSPRDWGLIAAWQEGGIPLRIVLQGIASVFDAWERRAPASRRINSLSYCRQEVLSLHAIWLGLQAAGAGRPGAGGDTGAVTTAGAAMRRHLGRLHRRLREAMATASEAGSDRLVAALAGAAGDLKRLRKDLRGGLIGLEELEIRLKGLDAAVVEAARQALPAERIREAEVEVERALAERAARIGAPALEAIVRAGVAHAIRRACNLPRLTLFDDTPH